VSTPDGAGGTRISGALQRARSARAGCAGPSTARFAGWRHEHGQSAL